MLHIVKLAVGVRDVPHLTEIQARRLKADPPLRHQTRNAPRRAPEIIDGGSIYWVITGAILVRQRILDIIEDRWDDDSKCSGLVLDPQLIRVQPRAMKPFQGWRYLAPADAPADIAAGASPEAMDEMPADLRRALHGLALL
jgi:hypothetical protein